VAPPRPSQAPKGAGRPKAEGLLLFFLEGQGKGANFTAAKQSSSRREGIAADPGWGSGKELDLMGQGGGGGRKRRESGEGREEVRTGGFLFLFCLNKRLRGFLSPFGFFGWALFGLRALSLSPLMGNGMERAFFQTTCKDRQIC
jgi:hypothetical protein